MLTCKSAIFFFTDNLVFLGYVVSSEGIKMEPSKVEAIESWPVPKSIHTVRSFHGMGSFYRRFIKHFITLVAYIIECMKGGVFKWTKEAHESFEAIKRKMTTTLVLTLLDFSKVFELDYDASNVGIEAVLSQEGRPIAFFSEKLNDAKWKYSTYDKEFYAIILALRNWNHYLLPKEFVLYSDHEALKYLSTQHRLGARHAKLEEFLQNFQFVLKHKSGQLNKVVDALSRRHALLNVMQFVVVGFEIVKTLYENDYDFGNLWKGGPKAQFFIHDGYLFRGKQLCIPVCSLRETIIWEAHSEGLVGHFGKDKTLILVQEKFYWPKLVQHVKKIESRCVTCHKAKMHGNNAGLNTPLPILTTPCEDVSMDFIVGLLRT